MHGRLALLVLAAAATLAPAQAASSADDPTPTASARLTACAKKKGGALRVATKCRRGERRYRLVAEPAPRGSKGDPGPKGDAGATGAKGAQGQAGADGADGDDGADGADGQTYTAGAGLDLTGTQFSLELPLFLVTNPVGGPSVIDVTNTRPNEDFGPVRPAAIEGTATATSHGNNAADAVTGVLGTIDATAPGGFSAGVRGVNKGTSGVGIGVVGWHNVSGWGVFGGSPSGYGVVGQINTSGGGGAAVRAAFDHASQVGTALELSNGQIKVTGDTRRPAFRVSVSTTCGSPANTFSVIDHPFLNGDANAIPFHTHVDTTPGTLEQAYDVGLVYNASGAVVGCTADRWLLRAETSTLPTGAQFDILVFNE